MTFTDPAFIIKAIADKKSSAQKQVLRRYKGSERVVTIPSGVEEIADFVFADDIEPNEVIEKIIIPDSVKSISTRAFAFCAALKEVVFPKNLTSFDIDFGDCPAIEKIVLPESVTSLHIPHSVELFKKFQVGPHITSVIFTRIDGQTMSATVSRDKFAKILAQNPAYCVTDGFVVNTAHKTSLFRVGEAGEEVRVPDGIEVIGHGTFEELYAFSEKSFKTKPVKKVTIPLSVKKIAPFAFLSCPLLQEVIYEGNAADIEISDRAFFNCPGFHKDGREIICKDSPKQKERKTPGLRYVRIIIIHRAIASGSYPNTKRLQQLCKENGGQGKASLSTISRDIEFLRDTLRAPIDYDYTKRGYHYTEPYSLNFD